MYADRLRCRNTPSSRDKCPITASDLKDMYNGLVKQMGSSYYDKFLDRSETK